MGEAMAHAACPLTIIVPFYDEVSMLGMAIDSIRAQAIAGLQIVIVNDNPEAFAAPFFADFIALDGVEIVHHQENLGLSAARNSGMEVARGAYLGFLDADDYFLAGGLVAQLAQAMESGADIVHAQTCISYTGSPSLSLLARDRQLFGGRQARAGLRKMPEAQFATSSWSSLYRRAFLEAEGLRFDVEQRKFEDRLFVLQSMSAARLIARLGQPVRVWRRRAGSISSSPSTAETHLLQVQLLEKCMAHMQAWSAREQAPARFVKREMFNTISRLIWDVDLLARLAGGNADPAYRDMGARVRKLLEIERLGQAIFSDPLVRAVSRVGMRTRKGRITRGDFFALTAMMRAGDFAGADALLGQRAKAANPAPARPAQRLQARLILHLGMHKTGTTAMQQLMTSQRAALGRAGVLVPETGLTDTAFRPTRAGGYPGHQGLMDALRNGDGGGEIWRALYDEVARSGAQTVIVSCENFLAPFREDREKLIGDLCRRLSGFDRVTPLALVRRADVAAEAMYREMVTLGHRGGARMIGEYLSDFGTQATDLAGVFAPFEAGLGTPLVLVDYDEARAGAGIWPAFVGAAGLPDQLADLTPDGDGQVYATPGRAQVAAMRMISAAIGDGARRKVAMRDFFRIAPACKEPDQPFLSPMERAALLEAFADQSGQWAHARGYGADLAAMSAQLARESWTPFAGVPAPMQEAALQAVLRSEKAPGPDRRQPRGGPVPANDGVVFQLRLRPWARAFLARFRSP